MIILSGVRAEYKRIFILILFWMILTERPMIPTGRQEEFLHFSVYIFSLKKVLGKPQEEMLLSQC